MSMLLPSVEVVKYQLNSNRVHTPTVEQHSLSTPLSSHSCASKLVGPIKLPSRACVWILAATECYNSVTKQ